MKHTYTTINYDYLSCPTGDPFADAGGYALAEFANRFPDLDIIQLIEKVTDIYVDRWNAKINPFFLNSQITQTQYDKVKKKKETIKYFKSLIAETSNCQFGICRIIGNSTALFPAGRNNAVLVGSGELVNFHHNFQEGIMISKEAIIRLFFLPLACEFIQKKLSVIHSSNEHLSAFFAKENCRKNLNALANNTSEGVLESEYKAIGTSLFKFIDKAMLYKQIEGEANDILILYHFTNYSAHPGVDIYTLPFTLLKFYYFTQRAQYRQTWNSFVATYYVSSEHKLKHDPEKKMTVGIKEDDFKCSRNIIYDYLMNGETILPKILERIKFYKFDWDIVEEYLIKIRNMKKETISKINEIANYILASNDEQEIKKIIKGLSGVANASLLRRFFINNIVRKYYNEGNKDAIIKVEDYTEYLFSDSNYWGETRDVLLIAIYQKMHERDIQIELELLEEEGNDEKE